MQLSIKIMILINNKLRKKYHKLNERESLNWIYTKVILCAVYITTKKSERYILTIQVYKCCTYNFTYNFVYIISVHCTTRYTRQCVIVILSSVIFNYYSIRSLESINIITRFDRNIWVIWFCLNANPRERVV